MADETDNLTLTILCSIQRDMTDMRAEVRERLDSVDARLTAIDTRLSSIDQQLTGLHGTNSEFRYRFERIERRLDLANADEH